MRRFDAHDDILILHRHRGGGRSLHVGEIVFVPAAAHSVAHDVQERQHARVRDRSMMRALKSSKLRQPAQPASATVVTPMRNV